MLEYVISIYQYYLYQLGADAILKIEFLKLFAVTFLTRYLSDVERSARAFLFWLIPSGKKLGNKSLIDLKPPCVTVSMDCMAETGT